MIVVSDSSPIINLAAISHLDLLPQLFGQVIIPPAVFHEIVVSGAGLPGAKEVQSADWIQVQPCADLKLLEIIAATKDIHLGEAEAICLAIELRADAVLLDEAIGRNLARAHHLSFIGILGILLKAKHKGLIKEVKSLMIRLQSEAGFYIHQILFQELLILAGE